MREKILDTEATLKALSTSPAVSSKIELYNHHDLYAGQEWRNWETEIAERIFLTEGEEELCKLETVSIDEETMTESWETIFPEFLTFPHSLVNKCTDY